MSDPILLDVDGAVATITMNRPDKLNAQSAEWTARLNAVLDELASSGMIRAAVITGSGRAFCAGGDIDHPTFSTDGMENRRPRVEEGYALFRRLRSVPFPIVAAVNGPAVGSGVSLAAACTIRLASRSAYFSLAFVDVGVVPDQGASFLLPQIIGVGRALHMASTGQRVDADTALAWGLVTEVCEDDELRGRAASLAGLLASKPPLALRYTKADMYDLPAKSFDEAMRIEAEHLNYLIGTADCREAVDAFKSGRNPVFRGS
ncbi:MAG: enoyl-CoA hydratase/isomerase family protein [Acidimicrobiales bacterium]